MRAISRKVSGGHLVGREGRPIMRASASRWIGRNGIGTPWKQTESPHRSVSVCSGRRKIPDSVDECMPQKVAESWEAVTGPAGSHLKNPHAKLQYKRLDLEHVMGWGSHRVNRPANYPHFLKYKAQYPDKLIALRSSDNFYFVGIDAIIVCEKLDVKAEKMATSGDDKTQCPRTIVPSRNADTAISQELCSKHNLDVVIVESRIGSKSSADRYVSQICTPHCPELSFSAPRVSASPSGDNATIIGVVPSRLGWELHCWSKASRTRRKCLGLTYELMLDRVEAWDATLPVYVQKSSSFNEPGLENPDLVIFAQAMKRLHPTIPSPTKQIDCEPSSFQARVEQEISGGIHLDGEDTKSVSSSPGLDWIDADSGVSDSPVIFQSTALNLGIIDAFDSQMPSLPRYLLPDQDQDLTGQNRTMQLKLTQLLTRLPDKNTAAIIRSAMQEAWTADLTLDWVITRRWDNICQLLNNGSLTVLQGTGIFKEIYRLLGCTVTALQEDDMAAHVDQLLKVARSPAGVNRRISKADLLQDCLEIRDAISKVVTVSPPPEFVKFSMGTSYLVDWKSPNISALHKYLEYYERSKLDLRAQRNCLSPETQDRLKAARIELIAAVGRCETLPRDKKTMLKYHKKDHQLSWYHRTYTEKVGTALGWTAFDGYAASKTQRTHCFLTNDLKNAQDSYQAAHREAISEFKSKMNSLCHAIVGVSDCAYGRQASAVRSQMPSLLVAKELNEWGRMTTAIARNTSTHWCLAEDGGRKLDIQGLRPYWMEANGQSSGVVTTTNNVCIEDEMQLLSGPNMSGKSTGLRSITAAVLLAHAGLPIPASSAQVPQYSSILFRNFTGDSPMENASGFALEAKEMGLVLKMGKRLPTSDRPHFICIDEFGKGTEDAHASALCAASLIEFDKSNFNGIFATHQHAILRPEMNLLPDGSTPEVDGTLKRTRLMKMQVDKFDPEVMSPSSKGSASTALWSQYKADTQSDAFVSQFTIQPGKDTSSLAFQVAYELGMKPSFIQRTLHWSAKLDDLETPSLPLSSELQNTPLPEQPLSSRASAPSTLDPRAAGARTNAGARSSAENLTDFIANITDRYFHAGPVRARMLPHKSQPPVGKPMQQTVQEPVPSQYQPSAAPDICPPWQQSRNPPTPDSASDRPEVMGNDNRTEQSTPAIAALPDFISNITADCPTLNFDSTSSSLVQPAANVTDSFRDLKDTRTTQSPMPDFISNITADRPSLFSDPADVEFQSQNLAHSRPSQIPEYISNITEAHTGQISPFSGSQQLIPVVPESPGLHSAGTTLAKDSSMHLGRAESDDTSLPRSFGSEASTQDAEKDAEAEGTSNASPSSALPAYIASITDNTPQSTPFSMDTLAPPLDTPNLESGTTRLRARSTSTEQAPHRTGNLPHFIKHIDDPALEFSSIADVPHEVPSQVYQPDDTGAGQPYRATGYLESASDAMKRLLQEVLSSRSTDPAIAGLKAVATKVTRAQQKLASTSISNTHAPSSTIGSTQIDVHVHGKSKQPVHAHTAAPTESTVERSEQRSRDAIADVEFKAVSDELKKAVSDTYQSVSSDHTSKPKVSVLQSAKRNAPGAKFNSCSTVYVLQLEDASGLQYYVGESDNFVTRHKTHQKTHKKKLRAVAFVGLANGCQKSAAKRIEADLIKRLAFKGFVLKSSRDGRNRSFGAAK